MENPTFEKLLQELERIVMQLKQGDVPLESALDSFEQRTRLSKHCQDTLARTEETSTKMVTELNEEVDFDENKESRDEIN